MGDDKKSAADVRAERLAGELRANLKKRKTQAKAQAQAGAKAQVPAKHASHPTEDDDTDASS